MPVLKKKNKNTVEIPPHQLLLLLALEVHSYT